MRKSILACTVSFLMSPMAGWALGMGDVQVNSTLNSPLNAEIELHSVTKNDLETLRVGLASKSIYSRADIERSEYLSSFQFKVVQHGGKEYIAITTRKPFREPYANFLIELTWGSGRLLREYTMLLDPPEFIKKQARPVTTASASRSPQIKRPKAKAYKKSSASTKPDYVQTPAENNADLSYGPTKRNDTLWTIAKGMAPANISVDQMMMAILSENPNAFIDNNINNLKAGYVLRIKDQNSLNKLSQKMARRQVKEQYQNWKNTRKQKANVNVVDRSVRAPETTPTGGELKLVTSGNADNAVVEGDDLSAQANQLKDDLVLASEELESREIQNQELRARIKELEELLKTKSSLVELKDESLAVLQKQIQIQNNLAPADETIIIEQLDDSTIELASEETNDALLSEHIDPSVELTKDEMSSREKTIDLETNNEVIAEIQEIDAKPVVIADTGAKSIVEPELKTKPVVKETPKIQEKSKAREKSKSLPEENIVDLLLSPEMLPYTAGGAGGFLVVLLALLGLRRKRGKNENEFKESILDSQITDNGKSVEQDSFEVVELNTKTDASASDSETSFLSDFTAEEMDSLQPDDTDADPIAEADVFMVYGRYQQAEELLQDIIINEPERLDYQMKLLEVYFSDNLKDSFAIQADVVKDLLQKTNKEYHQTPEWSKATTWAEKLDLNIDMPDSFEDNAAIDEDEQIEKVNNSVLSLDDTQELILNNDSILGNDNLSEDDLNISLDELPDSSTDIESIDDLSLDNVANDTDINSKNDIEQDFDLSLDDLDEQSADSFKNINDNSFNLDATLDMGSVAEINNMFKSEKSDVSETSFDLDDSFELDNTEQSDSTLDKLEGDSLELEGDSLELEGDSLELEGDSLELEEDSLQLEEDSLELEEDSLKLEDDSLKLEDEDLDFDDIESEFPELDAVGTKLDLAKAYIDMGDMESANSILNEVIDEGDDEQKSQAQALLDQAVS